MGADNEDIFQKLMGIIFSTTDPEVEKKRQLRAIAKTLSKSRYKWYRPGSEEALPGMGKFFYELYKVVGTAQVILQNANSSMVLKNVLIELSLSSRQVELKERLSEDAIKERAKSASRRNSRLRSRTKLPPYLRVRHRAHTEDRRALLTARADG
jgi:energy-coupling factor transporter ATP-binding protein EcfA2